MDSCGLGEDGAIALAKSLPSARTLLVLDIRGNDIGARKSSWLAGIWLAFFQEYQQ